jgi:cell wall integrity and stress response component
MTEGDACWCGDQLPALDDKVDKSECDTSCVGFPSDVCGGNGLWSVYTTESGVENYGGSGSSGSSDSSSSSPSSTTKAPQQTTTTPSRTTQSVVTSTNADQTIVVTVPATVAVVSPTNGADTGSGGNGGGGGGGNTAGIAAGVVVGVVAIAAIIGGVYFFLRRRRQKAAEEDFKSRTQVSDFMRGGDERKPPATGYSGTSDARLDPEAGRRDSVGSLADNQDYSRRILRVANPSD